MTLHELADSVFGKPAAPQAGGPGIQVTVHPTPDPWAVRIHFDTNMEQVEIPARAEPHKLKQFLDGLNEVNGLLHVRHMPMERSDFYRCSTLIWAGRNYRWQGGDNQHITFEEWVQGQLVPPCLRQRQDIEVRLVKQAYVELLAHDWPDRRTERGQALLNNLRDHLVMITGNDAEDVQTTAESEACKLKFGSRR